MAVPLAVLTVMGPVLAPLGTVAVIWVEDINVKLAVVPLNFTAVAPVNPEPLMVTLAPTAPLVGVRLLILGSTRKLPALVAVPPGVITLIGPLRADWLTMAVIWVALLTVKLALLVLLNFTAVAPKKFVPVITTLLS